MAEFFLILTLADLDDLLGLVFVVIFAAISLVSNLIKSASEKSKQQQSLQEESEKPSVPAVKAHSPASATGRTHHPPAKIDQTSPKAKPANLLELVEALKQKQLSQIPQQNNLTRHNQGSLKSISRPDLRRPKYSPPAPSRPVGPAPSTPSIKTQPIPAAQPALGSAAAIQDTAIKTRTKKYSVHDPSLTMAQRNLIAMLKDRKMLRSAIVASEILGKPISLR